MRFAINLICIIIIMLVTGFTIGMWQYWVTLGLFIIIAIINYEAGLMDA